MAEDDFTTIRIRNNSKAKLDELKVHPNQSYDEIIIKLLNEYQ